MILIMILPRDQYVQKCWDNAYQYINGVLDESIVTNENVKYAILRHQSDLERDDLEFRDDAVERVFKFFSYLYVEKDTQFKLEPFQAFIILALFGLYFKATEIRKYLYAFLFLGRKNGKTTFVSALQLYFMMGDKQPFPRSILISASQTNTKDTSFAALQEIIQWSPAINSRVIARRSNKVEFRDTNKLGWCKTTVMDTKKLEGYNPTSCILDEIHTYKDGQKFNVIKNGLGTKINPMLFLISTGGVGKDSFCTELVEIGRSVVRGEMEDDRFFYLLYELDEGDDWKDEKVWIKANPALGTILDYKTFKDAFKSSMIKPSALNDFLTKRLNMFLDENVQWVSMEKLKPVFTEFSDDEVKGLPCYLGLDLSATRDLTSIAQFWDGGDKFYAKVLFFFVKTEDNILRKGNIDISKWIDQGYIIEATTPTIDYRLIVENITDIIEKYNVKGIFSDPWKLDRIKNELNDQGYMCVGIPPFHKYFDPAVRLLESMIYEKRIDIYKNDCMIWNFRNVVMKPNQDGLYKPDKNVSKDAIDGLVALLIAMGGYLKKNSNSALRFLKSLNTNEYIK